MLNLSLLVSTVFTGSKLVLKLPFCFSVHSTSVLLWIISHSCVWCTWGFLFLTSDLFTRHSPRRTANFLLPSKKTDQVFLVLISGIEIFMALAFRQLVHLPPVSSWYQYQRVLISNLQTLNSIYYSNHIVLFFPFFFLLYCSNFELPLCFGTCTFSVLGLFFSDACKNSWYNFIQHFQKFEVGRTIIYFISICHIHDSITVKPTTVALILAVQVAKPSMHSP